MNKLNGTVTLSFLEEDDKQKVIFRIIPLSTKEGLVFTEQIKSYPDQGSIRIIPDKREQSSFKDRMRSLGSLCCVQLCNDGKELTKIRQNRNYDPNQNECNQYAVYSDVICGFEKDAAFQVFQDNQSYNHSLTDRVLIQRGMVLYGPVNKEESLNWDTLRPFGNENYLLHTVTCCDDDAKTFYWNPDAIITWRQRKKMLKRNTETRNTTTTEHEIKPIIDSNVNENIQEVIPIGKKLEILNERLSNDEQITELNRPVSVNANRLEAIKHTNRQTEYSKTANYQGTPISETSKNKNKNYKHDHTRYNVVEKQIKEHQLKNSETSKAFIPLDDPIDNLKQALEQAWQIPSLHQEFVKIVNENERFMEAMLKSGLGEKHKHSAYAAARAELDEIEAQRIALLIELDKAKSKYNKMKDDILKDLTKEQQTKIENLKANISDMQAQKETLHNDLIELGQEIQDQTASLLQDKATVMLASDGSDLAIIPAIGKHLDKSKTIDLIRTAMNENGFICRQDCITEVMILMSLCDEFCILGNSIYEAEIYVKTLLSALGLLNMTAWPNTCDTLHLISTLPNNDLRTPTVEVLRDNRKPIKAYGHKTIRLVDENNLNANCVMPVFRIPKHFEDRSTGSVPKCGDAVSLKTINEFNPYSEPLHKEGINWINTLSSLLREESIPIPEYAFQGMLTFARVASPQLIGGFLEAADTAALTYIVPILKQHALEDHQKLKLIGDLPRSMRAMKERASFA